MKAVNKIKRNPLKDGPFNQLCQENDEQFEQLPFNAEVTLLSKGYFYYDSGSFMTEHWSS